MKSSFFFFSQIEIFGRDKLVVGWMSVLGVSAGRQCIRTICLRVHLVHICLSVPSMQEFSWLGFFQHGLCIALVQARRIRKSVVPPHPSL